MAYMSQEKKKELAPGIKAVLKKYNMKGTISVDSHMSLAVTLRSGPLDIIGATNQANREYAERTGNRVYEIKDNFSVNQYQIDNTYKEGVIRDFLKELYAAMMVGNHGNSDSMSDYFDVGWYTDINVGRWDKPYALTEAVVA